MIKVMIGEGLFCPWGIMDFRKLGAVYCLELLAEPWFYAVRGNHEIMMLDYFQSYLENRRIDELAEDKTMEAVF